MEQALSIKPELTKVRELLYYEYARENRKGFAKRLPIDAVWLEQAKTRLVPPAYSNKKH